MQAAPAKDRGTAIREGLKEWLEQAPSVTCHPEAERIYARNLVDIAALRFRPDNMPDDSLPAAGLPWFMAVFGRDSLITSYQMLPFAPELAKTTLHALAASQGKQEVELTEEEPGRILHELRFGELTHFRERPQAPYYGASDTTPLFLVLLAVLLRPAPGSPSATYAVVARTLSGFSYSLYVIHLPFLVFLRATLLPRNPVAPVTSEVMATS